MRLLTLKTILVATDLDEGSDAALATARALAEAAGAKVHVVLVSNDQTALGDLAAWLGARGFPPEEASINVVRGVPAFAINTLGDQISADAILIGPHREGHRTDSDVLGSTALAVVTNASVPCLVVDSALPVPLRRVIAAVDISDSARGTLAVALSWTSALREPRAGTESSTVLTVLHVRQAAPGAWPTAAGGTLEEMVARVRRDAGSWSGATIEDRTISDADAAHGIASYAKSDRADLVILGTCGLGVDRVGRIGSVSAAVMKQIDLPVLLVPPALWTTLNAVPS